MNKQTKVWLVLSIALSLLVIGSSCGGNKNETPGTNTNGGATASEKWTGATGTISGVISFEGTPPAPKKIDTAADPVCGQKNPNLMTDDTVVKDGKLANVFVYVKEGTVEGGKKFADYTWDVPGVVGKLLATFDRSFFHVDKHIREFAVFDDRVVGHQVGIFLTADRIGRCVNLLWRRRRAFK